MRGNAAKNCWDGTTRNRIARPPSPGISLSAASRHAIFLGRLTDVRGDQHRIRRCNAQTSTTQMAQVATRPNRAVAQICDPPLAMAVGRGKCSNYKAVARRCHARRIPPIHSHIGSTTQAAAACDPTPVPDHLGHGSALSPLGIQRNNTIGDWRTGPGDRSSGSSRIWKQQQQHSTGTVARGGTMPIFVSRILTCN